MKNNAVILAVEKVRFEYFIHISKEILFISSVFQTVLNVQEIVLVIFKN